MEREKRQEFVERTKNLLTTTESQPTSEKAQRSTGGSKKVFNLLFQNNLTNLFSLNENIIYLETKK